MSLGRNTGRVFVWTCLAWTRFCTSAVRLEFPNILTFTYYVLEADGDLTCQAGARWEDINQELKNKGIPLFFPVSRASVQTPVEPRSDK